MSKKAVPQVCHPSHIYHLRLTIEYVDGYKDRGAHGYEGRPGVSYPALVSNVKGLENLLQPHHLLAPSQPIVSEIAIFTAASDSFNKANTNKTVAESLVELEKVVRLAKEKGLKVRGYVSTVITCPFEGKIDPKKVVEVGRDLLQMGCYEVSLGDTVGTGTERTVRALMDEVQKGLPIPRVAVSLYPMHF